jgi:hypothetical protein
MAGLAVTVGVVADEITVGTSAGSEVAGITGAVGLAGAPVVVITGVAGAAGTTVVVIVGTVAGFVSGSGFI